jgi:ribosomal protein S27AE
MRKSDQTICGKCHTTFEIDPNRSHKIREKTTLVWFVDAMNQFENFSEVTCPSCGNRFKAEEARLFVFFKSPYTVIVFGILLFGVLVGVPIVLKYFVIVP